MTSTLLPPDVEPDPSGGDGGPVSGRYASSLHDTRLAALLGSVLGVTFTICFLTGLLSHLIQHPPGWFDWTTRPAGTYRITQGVHVATGLATIPLVLAKLWVVAPRFWAWPPAPNVAKGVERIMLFPLVAGAVFLLLSGTLDTFGWYPWAFSFPIAHYWASIIFMGGLVAHIGSKYAVTWAALRRGERGGGELAGDAPVGDRRRFLGGVAFATLAITVATVGQTLRPLRAISTLAPRDPAAGPQGFPVNKSATSAGVIDGDGNTDERIDDFHLDISGKVGKELSLNLAELQAMTQRTATLPIACVEGWSASATWRGVPLRDLLDRAGVGDFDSVEISSLQENGSYRSSKVSFDQAADLDMLMALEVNGEPLDIEHGYPLRLIGPARSGVLQTKWVGELVVS